MCGRAKTTVKPSVIRNILDGVLSNVPAAGTENVSATNQSNVEEVEDVVVNNAENLSPGMMMHVAFLDENNNVIIKPMLWGINLNKMCLFNTQVECLKEKPMYWKLASAQCRGVVLIDGYYEWKANGRGKPKTKYLITPSESDYFVLPVIFNKQNKFTILTRDPVAETIREIHDRQPVILSNIQIKLWVKRTEPKYTETIWNQICQTKMSARDFAMNIITV